MDLDEGIAITTSAIENLYRDEFTEGLQDVFKVTMRHFRSEITNEEILAQNYNHCWAMISRSKKKTSTFNELLLARTLTFWDARPVLRMRRGSSSLKWIEIDEESDVNYSITNLYDFSFWVLPPIVGVRLRAWSSGLRLKTGFSRLYYWSKKKICEVIMYIKGVYKRFEDLKSTAQYFYNSQLTNRLNLSKRGTSKSQNKTNIIIENQILG